MTLDAAHVCDPSQANLTSLVEGEVIANENVIGEMLTSLTRILDKAMQDRYGSHLTRNLVKICTAEQRLQIWESISGKFIDLATNHFGKWTLQELIKAASTDREFVAFQASITTEDIFRLSKDRNGAHVLKTCVFELESKVTQFVYVAVAADIMRLAR
jgi:hypothetical protein